MKKKIRIDKDNTTVEIKDKDFKVVVKNPDDKLLDTVFPINNIRKLEK